MAIYPQRKLKGKWRVRIFVRGKAYNWVVDGTKKEAEAFEAHKRVEMEQQDPGDRRAVPTFSNFCANEYKAHAKVHLKPTTWSKKQIFLVALLVEFFGNLKLNEFDLKHVEAYMRARLAANLNPTTINGELQALHRILTYAQELGYDATVPKWKRLKQRGQRSVTFWTEKEVGQLLAKVAEKSPDILPLVIFLANTGTRRGEAINLVWGDVDIKRREIRVQAKPDGDWSPKTEKWRTVPINDALLPFLGKPGKASDPLFPSVHTGEQYAYWPQRAFDRARRAAGLKGGPHTLRHTYASHFLKHNPDLYLLGRVLGHSHGRVTELYAHLLPDALAAARKAVKFTSPVGAATLKPKKLWRRKGNLLTLVLKTA